jgi:hypothetical protein
MVQVGDIYAARCNNHNLPTMIPLYILLILSCLALGLIIFNVAVSQKAINIILLIGLILVAVSGLWGDRLAL